VKDGTSAVTDGSYSNGMIGAGGLLLILLGLFVQYLIIRLAVRHGIRDVQGWHRGPGR